MRILLTILFLAVTTTGCRRSVIHSSSSTAGAHTLIAGTVIKSAGSWTASNSKGSTLMDISVSGTSVNWSITTKIETGGFGSGTRTMRSGSSMSLSSPSDPWFIFVESSSRLWFFNGTDDLNYQFRIPSGTGSEGGASIHSGTLSSASQQVPPDLIPQLPPDLRKLFPAIKEAPKRPSI